MTDNNDSKPGPFSGIVERIGGLARSQAAGAVAAQVWQAVGSFGLQILASHLLGNAGLGLYASCYAIIVMGTSLSSGIVGDSLTVLDRQDPRIRSGLQSWAVTIYLVGATAASIVLAATHQLTVGEAVMFGVAMAMFQLEETLRRIFMAHQRFWWLLVVDGAGIVVSFATLFIEWRGGHLTIASFLRALLLGQVAAAAVGVLTLPSDERWLARGQKGGMRAVIDFGLWRGLQITIPTIIQAASRWLIVAAVGQAVLGTVEAARIFVAPLQLTVNGLGGYLMASFVNNKALGQEALVKRAGKASLLMAGATLLGGAVITALVPYVGHFVSGTSYTIPLVAVACWVVYTARSAAVMAWSGLAASVANQRKVTLVRCIDAALALPLLAIMLWGLHQPAEWSPLALTIGQLVGGAFLRRLEIREGNTL